MSTQLHQRLVYVFDTPKMHFHTETCNFGVCGVLSCCLTIHESPYLFSQSSNQQPQGTHKYTSTEKRDTPDLLRSCLAALQFINDLICFQFPPDQNQIKHKITLSYKHVSFLIWGGFLSCWFTIPK